MIDKSDKFPKFSRISYHLTIMPPPKKKSKKIREFFTLKASTSTDPPASTSTDPSASTSQSASATLTENSNMPSTPISSNQKSGDFASKEQVTKE